MDLFDLELHVVEFARVGTGGARLADLRRGLNDLLRLELQIAQDRVPVVEALAARLAVRRRAHVASVASVALSTNRNRKIRPKSRP